MSNPPSKKTIHSQFPQNSDTISRDLKNLVKSIIQSKTGNDLKAKVELFFQFIKKHRLDIESQCKKNGWLENSVKDFAHSLNRVIEFSHEYLTSFPKDSPEHLIEQLIESSEELLFFLNNESY